MRTIVHLSDLHFDWVEEALIPKLIDRVASLDPQIVAVSGDFTQHAWPSEFEKARDFVRQLPGQLILVPGNHDMAFLNPWRRAVQRLKLYKRYITNNLQPFFSDGEVAILGLNTARVLHLRNGRIREWQVDHVEEIMEQVPPSAIRILVTHHPFDLPESYAAAELIGSRAMKRLVASVDLMLAGHMHISHAAPTALRYNFEDQSAVFVQAGTALSTRGRGEPNSFQVIRTDSERIDVEQFSSDNHDYHPVKHSRFKRSLSGWKPEVLEVLPSATEEDLRMLEEERRVAESIPGNEVRRTGVL